MTGKKRLVILGVTGSIGESTLKVIRKHPEKFELVGAASQGNVEGLGAIAKEFNLPEVCIYSEEYYKEAKSIIDGNVTCGMEGLGHLASLDNADMVVMAIPGVVGLNPALKCLEAGKALAVASKEILVMAGNVIMETAREHCVPVLPLDSEHNAIFQCLRGNDIGMVEKLILTASGGPFRDYSLEQMHGVTIDQALKHPTWSMGKKVTLDCATMANKGLELIEAKWLFGVEPKQLDVLVHPQSIIHSMVKYVDGSHIAQLSPPCMTHAIQYAMEYPKRSEGTVEALDFTQAMVLELRKPDLERFPCLRLAMESLAEGGMASTVFNAANEVAAAAFMDGKIGFLEISEVIDKTMNQVSNKHLFNLDAIIETHDEAVTTAKAILNGH